MSKNEDNKEKQKSSSRDSEGETFTVVRGKQDNRNAGRKREAESPKPKSDGFGNDESSLTVEGVYSSDGCIRHAVRGDAQFGDSTESVFPSNQTLTDIDSLPRHYIVPANKTPHKSHQLQNDERVQSSRLNKRKYSDKCQHLNNQNGQHCLLNRYNKSQVIIRRDHSPKQWFNRTWFGKRKKNKYMNMAKYGKHLSNGDSGETIPQLYKAKVNGHLSNIPDLFKFRAVGRQEIKANHARIENIMSYKKDALVPCECTKRASTQFDSTKHKQNTENNGQLAVKNNINDPSHYRAYLNFDGTEYISISELPARIDIYCFDHLNTSYFRTTDQPPPLMTDEAIQKTEDIATRFWAEIFGFLHLFISFIIAFILQLYKFILFSFIRPLLSGLVQLTADYLLKPLLTIAYNGLTQPTMVFLFNLASSFRDICHPVARGFGYFLTEFSVVLRAIRLVEWNRLPKQTIVKDSSC